MHEKFVFISMTLNRILCTLYKVSLKSKSLWIPFPRFLKQRNVNNNEIILDKKYLVFITTDKVLLV